MENFNGQCPFNQLEVKKTPKKPGRKPKNATNKVQTINNPAFCILSNIVFKLT
jgi:hypothetical protein